MGQGQANAGWGEVRYIVAMSEPIQPAHQCPRCRQPNDKPVNVSCVYEPSTDPTPGHLDQHLSSTTYTYHCVHCGHKYAFCEDAKG